MLIYNNYVMRYSLNAEYKQIERSDRLKSRTNLDLYWDQNITIKHFHSLSIILIYHITEMIKIKLL